MELLIVPALPLLLLAASTGGSVLRHRLGERHRSAEIVDALRLVMSMMITFAALVLGLLTSSAKSDFDARVRSLQTFGISLIELDQRLREFGPEADDARRMLRRYTAAALADTWPGEPAPPGDYPRLPHPPGMHSMESAVLSNILLQVDERIAKLVVTSPLQRRLAPVLESRASAVLERRWELVVGSSSSVAWPFLAVLLLWLGLAFFTFGLSTPLNKLTTVVLVMAAVSVSAAVYLIVDFGTPSSGLLALPSTPLRDALAHMDGPGPQG